MLRSICPALLAITVAVGCDTRDRPPGGTIDSGLPDTGVVDMDAGTDDSGVVMSKCEPMGNELQVGTAPVRRGDMAFAWDPTCERVMMFFGDKAEPMNCGPAASDFLVDGYTFDPARNAWAEIDVAAGAAPLQRARSSGAWDPSRQRFVLFGGRYRAGTSGAYDFPNDIWAFDVASSSWMMLAPENAPNAPSGRMNTVMVYDPVGDRILIHDGGQVDATFTQFLIDAGVWAFDLSTNTWSELTTNGTQPTPRLFHMGALDTTQNRLYVFAGGGEDAFTSPDFFRDLWQLDLGTMTWFEMPAGAARPAGRIKGVMDFDTVNNQVVLFAGHDDGNLGNDNDLWAFHADSLTWEQLQLGDTFNRGQFGFCDFPSDFANVDMASPERRESHLFLIRDGVGYMYGGRTDCGLSNDTWKLDMSTNTWEQVNQSFNGMTCYRSGRTDCDDPQARKCG